MGAQVYTIERQKMLFDTNKQFAYLKQDAVLKFLYGDGYEVLPTYGPFDKIIVTAAAPFIPPKLVQQLKPGGKMVIPVGEGKVQRMLRLTRQPDGTITEELFDNFSFVPMIGGRNG